MAHVRELDPSASPSDCFGYELRRKREEVGLTQKELGDIIFCTGSLIGQIETTLKVPTREFAERVDAALMTDGIVCAARGVGLTESTAELVPAVCGAGGYGDVHLHVPVSVGVRASPDAGVRTSRALC